MKNYYLLSLLFVLLVGCEFSGHAIKFESVVKDDGRVEGVYFCPRDDCSGKLSEFILSASDSVYCAFYDLDLENVIDALEFQSKNIDVRLIVDSDNFEYVEGLEFVKQDNRSAIMHDKFCIVDSYRISSGSMNPTINGDEKNNNNLIFIESSVLANNYEEEFEEMWQGTYGKGSRVKVPVVELNGMKVENYFCPEDSCSEKIKKVLDKAENHIKFLMFSFTHVGIANSILMRMQDGVSVQGVFEKRLAGTEYSRFKLLEYQGADVKKDVNPATMHHKLFIIDDSIVVTGSFNPSKNADTRNDENILIIYDKDVASLYLEEFEHVWNS